MAFWKMAAVAIVGGLIHKARKTAQEEKEEQERRIQSWRGFNGTISEHDFMEIVKTAKRGIKRLKDLSTDGPIVYGVVRTQSGLSEWCFKVDFNDYGRLTGAYWLSSDNDDSSIPEYVADAISLAIKNFSPKPKSHDSSNSNMVNSRKHTQKICPYCGKPVTVTQAKFCVFCGKALR